MTFDPKAYLHERRTALHRRYVKGRKSQALFEFVTFGIKQAWACLFLIQALMLVFKLETWEEARIILIFHIVGTVMEIFKTHMGSWIYPEASVLNIMGVPLFSGFMYACVGSLFDFRFDRFPPLKWQAALAVLAYINFFAHHYLPDIRWFLFAAIVLLYGRSIIWFKADEKHRPMPLIIAIDNRSIFSRTLYLVC